MPRRVIVKSEDGETKALKAIHSKNISPNHLEVYNDLVKARKGEKEEEDLHYFSPHFGHDKEINKNVYQSPHSVQEIVRVGKILDFLDSQAGISYSHETAECHNDEECSSGDDDTPEKEVTQDDTVNKRNNSSLKLQKSLKSNISKPNILPSENEIDTNDSTFSPSKSYIKKRNCERKTKMNQRALWLKSEENQLSEFLKKTCSSGTSQGKSHPSKAEIFEFMDNFPKIQAAFTPNTRYRKIRNKCINTTRRLDFTTCRNVFGDSIDSDTEM